MFARASVRFLSTISLKRNTYCVYQHAYKLLRNRLLSTHHNASHITRILQRACFIGLGGLCALPIHHVKEAGASKGLPKVNPDTLTSSTLIKNAAAMTVDSASALLTQTFVAVIDKYKDLAQDLETILNSALMTLEAASEAAFQAGNEELAMMGRDRCQYVNTQIALTRAVIHKAENALVKLQAETIKETKTDKEDGEGDSASERDSS